MSAEGSSTPLSADLSSSFRPKKKRTNVGKACEPCRRRRCKCDGIKPSCTTCAVYKDECYWEPREDYRKPLSRQQVQALTTRVQDLERLLREHGLDPGTAGNTERAGSEDEGGEHRNNVEPESSGDMREWSQDHLVEGETGELQVHGPTSAFRHLSKYNHEGSRDLNHEMSPESPESLPFGYSRYLPQDVYLNEVQHDQAIDRFFTFYACWDMRTALHTDSPVKTAHYSPMLHNAILAIALGFSEWPYLRASDTRKIFAKKAKDFIDYEGMNPAVATVQAFAHLASYHSLAAEHNLVGLNMDDTRLLRKGNVTAVQAREEGLWAPYIGRSISLPEFTALPPTIDDELDNHIWNPEDPPTGTDCPLRPQPGMISTTFVHTVKLMRIGERIMNTFTWLESLPPALTFHNHAPKNGLPHILMLHLSQAWLVILLHRPFYRPLAGLPSGSSSDGAIPPGSSTAAWAVKQCDRAALQVITLLQIWHRLHNLRFCPPTAIQCCFIAGTTHLLSLASSQAPKKQTEALGRAQECIRLMKLMAVSWPAARGQQVLLENLLSEYGLSLGSQRLTEQIEKISLAKEEPPFDFIPHTTQNLATRVNESPMTIQDPPQVQNTQHAYQQNYPNPINIPSTPLGMTLAPSTGVINELNAWMSSSGSQTAYPIDALSSSFEASSQPSMLDGFMPNQGVNPATNHHTHTAWNPNGFELDRETQALLDNILRPHLDVEDPLQYEFGSGF
ncbi:uncharacterized protein IL334_004531 [Kwoniella shivajii]|uniref:Zn(2)-C6 fungal-type domain-containing protein n=1 Tax=Kwoniella shivajii TaxID=564305 RepID=A0ABZ1D1Y4_9TREE|nr:hypothetical protein IL334_004531 [Kwoniella shivajii]